MLAVHAFETLLKEERIPVRFQELLGPYTTLKIGGPADYFVEPRDEFELSEVIRAARECEVRYRVIGSGANLLIGDAGARGAVVRLNRLDRRSGMHVQAGCKLTQLVKETAAEGLSGLECLAGVPAAIGGAVRMNAGGRHGEIAGALRYVDVMMPDGEIRQLTPAEAGFRYRGTALGEGIVVGAGLALTPDPDVWAKYEAILRDKKESQPLGRPNAGCMFKNPPGGHAGKIIEEAGLKGERVGRVHVSRKHANFFINEGGATAADVYRLIDVIRARARVDLELEVQTW